MSACVRGCVLRGEHVSDCQGDRMLADGRKVQCRGCLPRVAEYGRLCGRCWGRLQSLVRTMPSLAEHLEAMAEPSVSSPMGRMSVGAVSALGSSLYPEALGVLDDLHAMVASWCEQVACERGLHAPVEASRWTVADAGGEREPMGPAYWGATRMLVGWLDPHLAWCAEQVWVDALMEDLVVATGQALRRFPMERVERRSEVPCPQCGCSSLLVSPPAVAGADEIAHCRVCGLVLSEEQWALTRERAVAVARAEVGAGSGV